MLLAKNSATARYLTSWLGKTLVLYCYMQEKTNSCVIISYFWLFWLMKCFITRAFSRRGNAPVRLVVDPPNKLRTADSPVMIEGSCCELPCYDMSSAAPILVCHFIKMPLQGRFRKRQDISSQIGFRSTAVWLLRIGQHTATSASLWSAAGHTS